jgi:hypothetical protein
VSQPTPLKKNLVPIFESTRESDSFHQDKELPREKGISAYTSQYRNSDGTKDTRCTAYYLIAVHEEAGVECAHVPLIADRFRLRYRDTSLPASSDTTRTLPRTESWVPARLESFSRPTSELLLDVVAEDGGTACSVRNGTVGRDGLVAGWPRLAGGRTKAVVISGSDGYEASVSTVLGKELPFYGHCGAAMVI